MGDIVKDRHNLRTDNIINYVNVKDIVPMANADNHLGQTYVVAEKPNTGFLGHHNVESFQDLYNREVKTPQELMNLKKQYHPHLYEFQNATNNIIKNAGNFKNRVSNITEKVGSIAIDGYNQIKNGVNQLGHNVHEDFENIKKNFSNLESGIIPQNKFMKIEERSIQGDFNNGDFGGDITTNDIYRKLYKNRHFKDMSTWEINQMLDDLI